MSGTFSQLPGGGSGRAEPDPPQPDAEGWSLVLELGKEWALVADPHGQPYLRDPAGERRSIDYEPAPGAGWVERIREWMERYDCLSVPLELRPSRQRKLASRLAVDYWTQRQRRFRVVHRCGCEEQYTLPEGQDGRREVESLRARSCWRCYGG